MIQNDSYKKNKLKEQQVQKSNKPKIAHNSNKLKVQPIHRKPNQR